MYLASTAADAAGNYSMPLTDGDWQVGLNWYGEEGSLQSMGFAFVGETTITVPTTNAVVNFTLHPLGTSWLEPPRFALPGNLSFLLRGAPGTNYLVQVSTNLADPDSWTLLTTVTLTSTVTEIWDIQATNAARFYRARVAH